MKRKIFKIMAAGLAFGTAAGCGAVDDGGSCGFAYNVKTGLSAGNLENVAFVDKDEELSLRFKYDGVTYAMDFPEESYQEIYGRMIYNCTFVSSDDRECLGMLIKTDEAYGSATGTVRFSDDIASDEAFSFVIAPNSSVLEDYRDALEEERIQLETWTDPAQQTQ